MKAFAKMRSGMKLFYTYLIYLHNAKKIDMWLNRMRNFPHVNTSYHFNTNIVYVRNESAKICAQLFISIYLYEQTMNI